MPYWSEYTPRRRKPVAPKADWSPVVVDGRTIARSFWGRAWCDNLESYADYANRLPRGRTYVRARAVVDLRVDAGVVTARVAGSSLYTTSVTVAPLSAARWDALVTAHASGIASVVSLLEGALPKSLLEALANRASGLFPTPAEMKFSCSCPDWASMCKHVAAVLYGVGARLDAQPELFFRLRGVEVSDLAARGGAVTFDAAPGEDALAGADLGALFGISLDEALPVPAPKEPTRVPKAARTPAPKHAPKAPKAPKPPKAPKEPALRVLTVDELDRLSVTEAIREPWVHGKILIPRPRGRFALTPRAEQLIPLLQGDRPAPAARRRRAPPRKALLAAMVEEACVDAYDEYEQATGFCTMLEDHVEVPFDSELLGEPLTVVGFEINDHASIDAICKRGRRRQRVPLESLPVPKPPSVGSDWIAAYRLWLGGLP